MTSITTSVHAAAEASAGTTTTPRNSGGDSNSSSTPRVWVRQSALDGCCSNKNNNNNSRILRNNNNATKSTVTPHRHSFTGSTSTASMTSTSSSTTPSLNHGLPGRLQKHLQQQQKQQSSSSPPPVVVGPTPLQPQISQSFSSSAGGGAGNHIGTTSIAASTSSVMDGTDFSNSSSLSDLSNHHHPIVEVVPPMVVESSGGVAQRVMQWGWKEGILIEQTTSDLTIQLLIPQQQDRPDMATSTRTIKDVGGGNVVMIQLPISALECGDVVLANDNDPLTQQIMAPDDLISLTHLHEPAVCVVLQHRYHNDVIYTNTGPVLLALNPFTTIPGLYGDVVQKKYVDAAEKHTMTSSLPPHVYAIADTAFRSMMRALEDNTNKTATSSSTATDPTAAETSVTTSTSTTNKNGVSPMVRMSMIERKTTNTTSSTPAHGVISTPRTDKAAGSNSSAPAPTTKMINQSILVSGESGSGKTVTTKFVMKYLAALSQRSVQLQESAKQRAHIKARQEQPPPPSDSALRNGTGNWRHSTTSATTRSGGVGGSATQDSASSTTAATTVLAGNSIEAQVLQSNPILESFGNARTVRNDNSSRFGKFIEIQFTSSGKLVGAVMQTYLLEKVRLNRQCPGERNYHIFYELLSGGMNSRELSQFFLASTAGPEDFKLTNATGTVTSRRDGVSDRETYSHLIAALTTMKFTKADIHEVFGITAAILHASNLTFTDVAHNDTCYLNESNVHLHPVCSLLGLSIADLNQALCHCVLTAGGTTVTRSLNSEQAINGLEALLKETYGAMFQYLVQRINGQISAGNAADNNSDATTTTTTSHPKNTGAATIGVLDIFGFESFAVNSFEQLCINYCNEALQQQFNAFVLENEQAEYEREGIQWSFIEFPENQDVLDLMEKRGSSILSILDDQCRAPGPSDKAFCLAVYSQCGNLPRFGATRKQQAMLQFSVYHYAGPVEYTVDGFTAKNKDELPKETIELLRRSEMPLVRELAAIMEAAHDGGASTTNGSQVENPTPRKLHRPDSSVGRPTVGGQFRMQLRTLRMKIDRTAPHYIRCLKPNDLLVPDHFDTAIVAEQLKCGGILEAVRVARAGFTQHYTHSDFCRRYRTLAWKEMAAVSPTQGNNYTYSGSKGISGRASPAPSWATSSSSRTIPSNRHSYPQPNYIPKNGSNSKTKPTTPIKEELSPSEAKALCKDLIKVLYRKIQQQGVELDTGSGGGGGDVSTAFDTPSPVAKAKTYTYSTPSSKVPSWSKKAKAETTSPPSPTSPVASVSSARPPSRGSVGSSFQPPRLGYSSPGPSGAGPTSASRATSTAISTPRSPKWKRAAAAITGSDLAKVGIQMGKTKVFLRHKAFEALERIRSIELTKAATKLNSIFRRYLARIAFIPYRDAIRQAKLRKRMMADREDFKETKEQDYDNDEFSTDHDGWNKSFQSARSFHSSMAYGGDGCFYDKWTEMQIKEAIHNPIPRHEWGKQTNFDSDKFKWVLRDGLWVKNYGGSSDSQDDDE